jgi:hypothetical protein
MAALAGACRSAVPSFLVILLLTAVARRRSAFSEKRFPQRCAIRLTATTDQARILLSHFLPTHAGRFVLLISWFEEGQACRRITS